LGILYPDFVGEWGGFHCGSTVEGGAEHTAQAAVLVSPIRVFEDISVDLEVCNVDSRCIWWVFDYTGDPDVLSFTARFAADMIWYPEIARVVSPHILTDPLLDCFLNREVIPGKLEHASAIGMALTSVLNIRLVMGPESQELTELCRRISGGIGDVSLLDREWLLVSGKS
jgi:hypothetical protein